MVLTNEKITEMCEGCYITLKRKIEPACWIIEYAMKWGESCPCSCCLLKPTCHKYCILVDDWINLHRDVKIFMI